MEYLVGTSKYSFSYQDLKNDYIKYKSMNDADFTAHLIKILHFSCFVCYIKEIPTHAILCDTGLIHELIHLLDSNTKAHAKMNLDDIRNKFNTICELA